MALQQCVNIMASRTPCITSTILYQLDNKATILDNCRELGALVLDDKVRGGGGEQHLLVAPWHRNGHRSLGDASVCPTRK